MKSGETVDFVLVCSCHLRVGCGFVFGGELASGVSAAIGIHLCDGCVITGHTRRVSILSLYSSDGAGNGD